MPFTVPDILPYLARLEQQTITDLGAVVRDASSPIHFSLYGRNGGTLSGCTPEKRETNGPTAYNAMRAVYQSAKRVGDEDVLNFCGRNAKLCTALWKPWIAKWRQPPGEDARVAPCGSMADGKGDTDPDRHINADSICLMLSDPDIRERGNISGDDALAFADVHWQWIISRSGRYLTNQREYLRYGFVGDSLVGLVDLYESLGATEKANVVFHALLWFFWHIYTENWRVESVAQDGTVWPIWNYGDLEEVKGFAGQMCVEPFPAVIETRQGEDFADRIDDPFNYGWRRFGSQCWYDGYLFDFLRRFWVLAVKRLGHESEVAKRAADVFEVQMQWYHPTRRTEAPLGDFAGPGAQDFCNTKLHGWTADGVLRPGERPMSITDWETLPDDAKYVRLCRTMDYHESDGRYHERVFQDRANQWHQRIHQGRVGIPWNSPDEAYVPDFESRGNNYLIADALFTLAAMKGDGDLEQIALCAGFDYLHAAGSSDAKVTKGKRIVSLAPPVNEMFYSRPWCWAMMCGSEIRQQRLGT